MQVKRKLKKYRILISKLRKKPEICCEQQKNISVGKKIKSYGELKNLISIDAVKDKTDNSAYLTHYLHTRKTDLSEYFISQAEKYFENTVNKALKNRLSENFKFDIPFPTSSNPKFTFIDLFAGIGGFRMAMQNLGGHCVFSSELDKYAKKTYELNFGEVPFGDITKIDENAIPEHDVLCAGFPCQAFSIAGKRKGFEETRGTLFFDIARILKAKRPKAFFLENVKGLFNHDKGRTLKTILKVLRDDLDYHVPDPKIMNAKDFGVPQNRERIFIVGFRNKHKAQDFEYPKPSTGEAVSFANIREENKVSVKYYLSDRYKNTLIAHKNRHAGKGNGFGYEIIRDDECANAIVVGGMGRERNIVIDDRLTDFTPVTKISGEVNKDYWRRMTPREWARLQGFPDKFRIEVSDVQAYKQFGNSVAVPAIQATAEIVIGKIINDKT